MFHVLVAEDEKNQNLLMSTCLKRAGYRAVSCADGAQALEILDSEHIDLIICDIIMPRMDGFQLTQELRQSGYETPILMVTAKGGLDDKRRGFSLGADDYMVKPIEPEELIMRVAAILRRSQTVYRHRLEVGGTVLDYQMLTVRRGESCVELPKKEFYLLYKLLSAPSQIFTRQQLMDEIWGMDTQSDERTVDVHIRRLREKFERNADFEIVTVRGLGYKAVCAK